MMKRRYSRKEAETDVVHVAETDLVHILSIRTLRLLMLFFCMLFDLESKMGKEVKECEGLAATLESMWWWKCLSSKWRMYPCRENHTVVWHQALTHVASRRRNVVVQIDQPTPIVAKSLERHWIKGSVGRNDYPGAIETSRSWSSSV